MSFDGSEIMARPGQTLAEHSRAVSKLCGSFSEKFGCAFCGELIGLYHDWGKAHPDWQKYLFSDAERGKITHAPESAAELRYTFPAFWYLFAYAVYGHHSSLPDWHAGLDKVSADKHIDFKIPNEQIASQKEWTSRILPELQHIITKPEQLPFLIRMLFSALVDADRLDAERAETPETANIRGKYDDWETLQQRFSEYINQLELKSQDTPVNRIRRKIRTQCENAAQKKPGFFSLNVPTGGGKTLSSLDFALKHQKMYNKSRIIYAIPYNSIIEQTAAVYKEILGDENVLEHHHTFVPPDSMDSLLRQKYELSAENWDMPVIVTTTVQLFESLLQGRASGSRKLHNIVNSIIILDEAQKLPPEHLNAVLTALRVLVERFNCTIVLCSATIPTVDVDTIGREGYRIDGLGSICPIISDPESLEQQMKRTDVTIIGEQTLDQIAEKIEQESQVLCIVNTRKRCLELFNKVQVPLKYHLSASMCAADRKKVLTQIRKDLKEEKQIVIISTSLIEAGVDIDVRTVFREIAGVDSIAQAAGRCNREGRYSCGNVYVFFPPESQPSGIQSFSANAARDVIGQECCPEMNQFLYRKYFEFFYAKCGPLLDKKDCYNESFGQHSKCQYQFRDFGENFHIIDDTGQKPLVILYGNAANLIEKLRTEGPSKELFRELGQYTVNIRLNDYDVLKKSGIIEEIYGVAAQCCTGIYVSGTGLQLNNFSEYQF